MHKIGRGTVGGLASLLLLSASINAVLAQTSQNAEEEEQTTVLKQIVVTASGHAQTIPDAPATITVISGEKIASKPYASVADVLRDVPGVIVSTPSARSGAASISIRGMSEGYVSMLVDGKPLGNSSEATYNGFGSGLATGYLPPPSAIERIEVIRGPMSSLYGSSALGGVINIITKPVSDVWTGTVTTGFTAYSHDEAGNSYEGRFYLNGPIVSDRIGLSLWGSLHNREDRGLTTGASQDMSRKSLGGKLSMTITENQDLALEIAQNRSDTKTRAASTSGVDVNHMNYSAVHKLRWGYDYETTSFLTYEDVDFENGTNISGYNQLNFNSKTSASLGNHDLIAGFDYKAEETRHSPNRVPGDVDPNMERWHWALFGEDNFHITEDFTTTFGLRYDNNERYGSHFTPRLYGVYHLNPALTFKGGMSGGYKVPSLKQADDNIMEPSGGDGRARDKGNTNLKPEESTNYEIGMVWESDLGLQFGLTAYHTRFKNKITTEQICAHDTPVSRLPTDCGMNAPGNPIKWINQYVNRDAAELNGVEATLDFPVGDVDVSMNYTYARSKITKGAKVGERFNNLPEHVANLGLDWHATEALTLWGKAQYRSQTYETNNNRIGSHAIFDVGMEYRINDHFKGTAAVYNIGDKRFDTNDYEDGRRFWLGLTSSF
jgi:outer membrane receptor for ferrienterochelin and colicins